MDGGGRRVEEGSMGGWGSTPVYVKTAARDAVINMHTFLTEARIRSEEEEPQVTQYEERTNT